MHGLVISHSHLIPPAPQCDSSFSTCKSSLPPALSSRVSVPSSVHLTSRLTCHIPCKLKPIHPTQPGSSVTPRGTRACKLRLPCNPLPPRPAWIERHPQGDTGLWMLKNNKQRGTGLRLVHTHEAFDACFETTTRPGLEGMILYRCGGSYRCERGKSRCSRSVVTGLS